MHIILGLSKRERAQYYSNVVSFVDKLIEIGDQLIHAPEALRSTQPHNLALQSLIYLTLCVVLEEKLESEIRYLGEHLVDGLYLPICGATDSHHCIVRLLPAESIPLHSKSRVKSAWDFYDITLRTESKHSLSRFLIYFIMRLSRVERNAPLLTSIASIWRQHV